MLQERFYVPIWRATDNTVPAVIGEPFSASDPPKLEGEKHGPQMEIKAYAGPMDKEQAQVFKKRLKTPPRLIASTSCQSPYNRSPIPQASPLLSPTKFKHNLLNNNYASTPVASPQRGRKLFRERLETADDDTDEDLTPISDVVTVDETVLDVQNGNVKHEGNGDEPQRSLDNETTVQTPQKLFHAVDRFFQEYRENLHNDSSLLDMSLPNQSFNYICEETSSVYDPLSVITSPPVKERHMRITDADKGVESVGRELAKAQNIGWKEYWKFLDLFVDLSSKNGLELFEGYLNYHENTEKPSSLASAKKHTADDSIFALCAGLNTLNLNKEEASNTPKGIKSLNETIKLLQERRTPQQLDVIANNNHIANPYLSIEKALQVYAKRTSLTLAHNTSIELRPILEQEIKKLEKLVSSFINDQRFVAVNLKKSHSRYGHLVAWYLKNDIPFLSPAKIQKIFKTLQESEEMKCVVKSFKSDTKFNPHSLNTEQECIEVWNEEPVCGCVISESDVSDEKLKEMRRKRRKLRLGLWQNGTSDSSGVKEKPVVSQKQLWAARTGSKSSDDEQDSGTNVEEDEVYYVSASFIWFRLRN